MSRSTLSLRFARDLMIALIAASILSGLIFAPLAYRALSANMMEELLGEVEFSPVGRTVEIASDTLPGDDKALSDWFEARDGIQKIEVQRQAGKVWVHYETTRAANLMPIIPLADLGYSPRTVHFKPHGSFFEATLPLLAMAKAMLARVEFERLIILSSFVLQLPFLLLAAWRFRRAKRGKELLLQLGWDRLRSSIRPGLWAGLGLAAAGLAYDGALRLLDVESWSIWGTILEFSSPEQVLVVFGGVLLAPIGEELFFRGVGFGSLAAAGYHRFGLIFTSLVFAAIHLDPIYLPFHGLAGGVLALAYLRSGSLLTPILAHSITNSFAFGVILLT